MKKYQIQPNKNNPLEFISSLSKDKISFDVKKFSGLQNMGNTCYMNASLQLFISCSVLSNVILNTSFIDNKLRSYHISLKKYFSKNNTLYIPNHMKKMIGQYNKKFDNLKQHDAHELLLTLINMIDDGIINESKNNNRELYVGNTPFKNLISNLFDINLVTEIFCKNCSNVSKSSQAEKILSLPIYKYNGDLKSFLDSFQQRVIIDKWRCGRCKKEDKALKKITIQRYPKYFIMQLKRFDNNSKKIECDINVNFEYNLGNEKYVLRSLIYHYGTTTSGHYVSFCKKGNTWYLCDDINIRKVNEEIVNEYIKKSYIFLFVHYKSKTKKCNKYTKKYI